jgi:hypothetical protein
MPRKPNPPPDDAEQAARFIETAKLLEADKTGEAFEQALGVVVPSAQQSSEKPKK